MNLPPVYVLDASAMLVNMFEILNHSFNFFFS